MQPESEGLSSGKTVTEGSVNEELLAACMSYCNHVYTDARNCSIDLLEIESTGCQAFCGWQSKTVPDQCEDLLIEKYDCVSDNDVPYSCEDEESSPHPEEPTCEEVFDLAEACLDSLKS